MHHIRQESPSRVVVCYTHHTPVLWAEWQESCQNLVKPRKTWFLTVYLFHVQHSKVVNEDMILDTLDVHSNWWIYQYTIKLFFSSFFTDQNLMPIFKQKSVTVMWRKYHVMTVYFLSQLQMWMGMICSARDWLDRSNLQSTWPVKTLRLNGKMLVLGFLYSESTPIVKQKNAKKPTSQTIAFFAKY